MARWLGLTTDPNSAAGGSTLDTLADPGPITIPQPTVFVPVTTAQVDPGYTNSDRNDEVRGVRGAAAPVPFTAAPTLTFTSRLYPEIAKLLLPAALGQLGSPTGDAPEAITTPVRPVSGGQLPALVAWVLREDQIDKLTGLWVDQIVLNVAEADPTIEVTCQALYHESAVTPGSGLPNATYATIDDPYASVTFRARTGAGAGTAISCVANFSLTFANNFEDDQDVRYCKGENVLTQLVDGRYRRRQYPGRHSLGEQDVTGTIGFGTTRADMEDRRLLATAERLVCEMTGNPLGTTPEADELLRLEMPTWVITGGSPDELVREGAIKSSYEFAAFVDPASGDDLIVEFVDDAPVTIA